MLRIRSIHSSGPSVSFIFIPMLAVAGLLSGCSDPGAPTTPVLTSSFDAAVQEIGQAAKRTFTAALSGANEVPPNDSRARGEAVFQLSQDGTEVSYRLIVANLHNVTMAHIHMGEAGVNGPVVVWLYPSGPPAQLIEGRSSGVLATGVITEASLVGQLAGQPLSALVDRMRNASVYVNVHTTQFPPGEIRGQIR
jgi:hypothetical protein